MAVIKDWIAEAAAEIAAIEERNSYATIDAAQVREIITRHCPFKPDTAYVEAQTSIQYTRKDSL